jgi:hypothetical protein
MQTPWQIMMSILTRKHVVHVVGEMLVLLMKILVNRKIDDLCAERVERRGRW